MATESLLSITDWIGVGTVVAGMAAAYFAARKVTTTPAQASLDVQFTEEDRMEVRRTREAIERLRHSVERLADSFPEHRRSLDDNTAELRRRRD